MKLHDADAEIEQVTPKFTFVCLELQRFKIKKFLWFSSGDIKAKFQKLLMLN